MENQTEERDKMIPVKNLYYMLSYAFQILKEQQYRNLLTEEYHNTADLFAAILIKGIGTQLKRGLGREYVDKTEPLSALQGKIDIAESIKTQSLLKRQMICQYDEFSENTEMNRILKATVRVLMLADIDKARKKELRNLILFFSEIEDIDLHSANWNRHYNHNNAAYQMLISICWLVYKGLLQSEQDGTMKLMNYLDEQRMPRLYEKFILEYYRKEHPELTVNSSQIGWQLDDGMDDMLPVMQSDIMLSQGNTVLIIDAKYYGKTTQEQYGIHTLHSNNIYQIFTYVKNKEQELAGKEHKVSGMLLYAKTEEEIVPDGVYQMSGNQISAKTLDLNCDFEGIRIQLDAIAAEHFATAK